MEKKFLNVREIAGRLGVSEKTIYNMVRAGRLPHLRIGGQYRFSIEEVDRALRQPAGELSARDKLHAAKSILERRLLFVALLTKDDRFWAKELLKIHQATIDWLYLERRSRAEGTEALLKKLRKDLA